MGELVMLTNDNLYKLPTLKPEIAERSEGDFLVIFTLIYQVYQPWGISSDYFLFVQGPFSNQGTCASLWSTALATPRRAPMPSSRGSSSIAWRTVSRWSSKEMDQTSGTLFTWRMWPERSFWATKVGRLGRSKLYIFVVSEGLTLLAGRRLTFTRSNKNRTTNGLGQPMSQTTSDIEHDRTMFPNKTLWWCSVPISWEHWDSIIPNRKTSPSWNLIFFTDPRQETSTVHPSTLAQGRSTPSRHRLYIWTVLFWFFFIVVV